MGCLEQESADLRGKGVAIALDESDAVRDFLTKLTGVKFEIAGPVLGYPSPANAKWVIRYLDGSYLKKSPHLWLIWAEANDRIWLESADIATSLELVENTYGEDGLVALSKIDTETWEKPEVQEAFRKQFPTIQKWFEMCERVLSEVSLHRRIGLEMRYSVFGRIVSFRVATAIDSKGITLAAVCDGMKSAIPEAMIAGRASARE